MANNYRIEVIPVLKTGEIQKQLKKAGMSGAMGSAGKKAGSAFGSQFATELKHKIDYAIIGLASSAIQDMVSNVLELDKAQTELKKVTPLAGKELEKFTEQAYEAGKATARTGTEMVQAATEFAKMGKSTSELLPLATAATMYQNIADAEISAGDAATFINSQMQAFAKEGLTANDVISKVNEVSNNFAVSSVDVATALTKTAGAFSTYGNTINETMGLVTAGTEIMPKQASKVARGWRTIGANIVKMAEGSNQLVQANGKVNISLKDQEGNMRSTFEVMKDLYKGVDAVTGKKTTAWKDLSDQERSNIALSLAGKSHMEVFAATLNNFENAMKAEETARGQMGETATSAQKENEKYLDSIEGHLASFRSAWEQFSYNVISSDLIKSTIDWGTRFINVLDAILPKINSLPGLFMAISAVVGGTRFLRMFTGFSGLAKTISGTSGAGGLVGGIIGFGSALNKANGSITKAVFTMSGKKGLIGSIKEVESELDKRRGLLQLASQQASGTIKKDVNDARKALGGITKSGAAAELDAMTAGLNKLKAVGVGLASAGVALAFVAVAEGLKKLHDAESFSGRISAYEEASSELSTINTQIAELETRRQNLLENGQDLTLQEKTQLEYLKAQKEVLEQEVELKKDLIKYGFQQDAKEKTSGGLAGDASQMEGTTYASRVANVARLTRELKEAEASGDTRKMTSINKELSEAYEAQGTSLERLIEAYNNLQYIEYESLKTDAEKTYFKDIVQGMLAAAQSTDTFRTYLERLPKEETVTITGIDENGNLVTITDKVENLKNLSDEEIQMIIDAQGSGDWGAVKKLQEDGKIKINFESENADKVEGDKGRLTEEGKANIKFQSLNYQGIKLQSDALAKTRFATIHFNSSGISKIASDLSSLASSVVHHATGKAAGAPGGLSWLGDEGSSQNPKPELVVTKNGAYLAGLGGWELQNLDSSDIVYSYAQTKKLLGGKTPGVGVEIPRFASGTANQKAFDNALATLEYKRDVYHWTDKEFQTQYDALYKKYAKSLSTDQTRAYQRSLAQYRHDVAQSEIEALTDVVSETGNLQGALDRIKKARDAQQISADEAKKMRAEVYKNALSYTRREYEAGKKSYDDLLKAAQDYWKEVGKDTKEYYDSLDELREASKKQLDTREERYNDELNYAQKYIQLQINSLQRQKEANDKSKEAVEDAQELVDLQNELAKARATMVKVYREGVGWVYEQDAKAIRDAQKALDDYNEAHATDTVDTLIERYQEVLELFSIFQEEADFVALGKKLGIGGIGDIIEGSILDVDYMSDWIKTSYTWINALEDLAGQLGNMSAEDFEALASTGITATMLADKFAQYGYSAGDIYAHLGLSGSGAGSLSGSGMFNSYGYIPNELSGLINSTSASTQNFNFEKLVLPNVSNANDFYQELQKLPNMAIQMSANRI